MTAGRVLVVDDDPALLDALSEALRLRFEGLDVDTSDAATTALDWIAAADYDAIVADIKMPEMDGLELLAQIKSLQPDTPTLLITGHGDHDLAVQALRAGAYDYITKPIDRDYFVTSLKQAIECRRLSLQVAEHRDMLEERADELEACLRNSTTELRELFHREQKARSELDTAHRELEVLHRQREQFVSMIAHELSAPLTTVWGYAEILGRPGVAGDARERARSAIVSETRRMSRLVGDLADAANLASGRFEIERSPCDLSAIAREHVEMSRRRTSRHSIELDAPPRVMFSCDRDRIGQLLTNLLTNAVKYTPSGEIRVRVWMEDQAARISVSDHGPGIPTDQIDVVFAPGGRLQQDGRDDQAGGTGLGLHIARAVVEAHGGRIWVENRPEGGASFQVSLPLAPESAASRPSLDPRRDTHQPEQAREQR
jgi:signal transduction histidine kinase